jgi:ElaB/YqjD/DUF883 family membrane-anchored ribosome-binding protein
MNDKSTRAADMENLAGTRDGSYGDIIEKLHEEKERLENELRQEYRNARKYVRSHPEESLAYAFIGGLVAGLVLARLFSR